VEEFICVGAFPNDVIADLAVQRLKSFGIWAMGRTEHYQGKGEGAVGGRTEVVVNPQDEIAAREVLAADRDG
jgi:hypothetical protein